MNSPVLPPEAVKNFFNLRGRVGISKKFYSGTFLCSSPTMKNFYNRCELQRFVTFAFKTTAFVKLWRYFCPTAKSQFLTSSLCLGGAKGDYHSTPGLLVIGYFPSFPIKGKTSSQGNVNFFGSLYWSRPMVISKCPFAG
jgi:hypothetical protein